MGVDEQAQRVVARFHRRTAGFQPQEAPPGAPQKRDIPKDHPYDPRALKPLSKALFAASVALGHTLAAHKHFAQVKSPAVSPDGRIGGKGYILGMDEVRRKLWEASEALSAVSDALHDEINAPHWKPKLAQLDENDREDVSRFVEEAEDVRDNPGEDAEEEIEKIDKENDGGEEGGEEETKSEVPGGGNAEDLSQVQEQPGQVKEGRIKRARLATIRGLRDAAETVDSEKLADVYQQSWDMSQQILSGLDCQVGGPRVDDRDPGGGDGPWSSFNPSEDATSDGWGYDGDSGEYDYPSEWDSNMSHQADAQQWAESVTPNDPDTPTEGRDFGIGYGAKGEAEEHLGEWGPHAGLPGSPWQATGDNTPAIDVHLNERHGLNALLPGDEADPVARTDYYRGDRGNLVNVSGGDPAPGERDLGLIDTGFVYEDLDTTWLPKGEPGLDVR